MPILSRLQVQVTIVLLFALSILVRHPLFNKELTTNWEFLAAHLLATNQLWYETPSEVHHFNLLYTFPRPEDKFIDNLGTSGVADRFGNYYYVSMPHLGFVTPYLFFVATGQAPSIPGLQIFALLVHFTVCILLYILARRLTKGYRGSRVASIAALCVLLFAPEALFFFQNGLFASSLVVPYSLGLLLAVTVLTTAPKLTTNGPHKEISARRAAWIALALCVLLGCLTDWHAYFTAFSTAVIALVFIKRGRIEQSTGIRIAAVCFACMGSAAAIYVLQNSRIGGFIPFVHTMAGRLAERVGASKKGMGLNSIDYYRNLGRFYVGYAPFIVASGILSVVSIRRAGKDILRSVLRDAGIPLTIAVVAVAADHIILANHTAEHSYTTLHDLVPIGLLMSVAVAAFMETSAQSRRSGLTVFAMLAVCVGAALGIYYMVYLNRPHPFRAAAATIRSAAHPSDVMFATARGI